LCCSNSCNILIFGHAFVCLFEAWGEKKKSQLFCLQVMMPEEDTELEKIVLLTCYLQVSFCTAQKYCLSFALAVFYVLKINFKFLCEQI